MSSVSVATRGAGCDNLHSMPRWILSAHAPLGALLLGTATPGCSVDVSDYRFDRPHGTGGSGGEGAQTGGGASGATGGIGNGGATSQGGGGSGTGAAAATAEAVALGVANPTRIALDASHLYWATNSGGPNCAPKIWRIAKTLDQAQEAVGSLKAITWDIAVTATDVVFATHGGDGVLGCDKTGACDECGNPPPTLLSFEMFGYVDRMLVDSSDIYFTASNSLYRCPLPACTMSPMAAVTTPSDVLTQDADRLYWADSTGILRCEKSSYCNAASYVLEEPIDWFALGGLAAFSGYVYWLDDVGLWRCPSGGCSSATLLTSVGFGLGLAVDASGVYFGTQDAILRCPHDSCPQPEELVTDIVPPWAGEAMVLDDEHVYWSNQNNQSIWRFPK